MAAGWIIAVRGLVQGVGFRPTVWQVATRLGLAGSVRNTSAGVTIELVGPEQSRDEFLEALSEALPPMARIDGIAFDAAEFPDDMEGFRITRSESGANSAAVVADARICPECAAEIRDPSNRRYRYAFGNCTHCGPRLTILEKIPYDRANTAMRRFPLCADCRAEYDNPADRRFHAEPIACPACGPRLWLERADGKPAAEGDALAEAAGLILSGKIVALKGLGGFHLACRADHKAVVARLRRAKQRSAKPLALMAADLAAVRQLAEFSAAEADILENARGPILLLKRKANDNLAPSVAPGQSRIGIMLPTTPLHMLLLDAVGLPLVMTSANESGLPQCLTNDEARGLIGTISDAVLFHDRDIVSRVDDSVARLDGTGITLIRRARGYAPEPLALPASFKTEKTVFAAGADLKSAFAFAGNGEIILSQHLGDLDEPETRAAYSEGIDLYAGLFERRPDIVAVDAHPGYVSSALGRTLAERLDAKIVEVQHHHAHLAACMAENGLEGGEVLGIVLDGTGYGRDGTIWGGEFLVGGYGDCRRVGHFRPVPLIGGDRAALEPWRNAYAHLSLSFGADFIEQWGSIPVIRRLAERPQGAIRSVMASRKLSPLSSSAGRLFDAAAFLIGIAPDVIGYEGQTGMELEALAEPHMAAARLLAEPEAGPVVSWDGLWRGLLEAIKGGRDPGLLAADFHATLIEMLSVRAIDICRAEGLDRVALTGGVFQNRILLEGLHARLSQAGQRVLVHHQVPANDGGIALGQAAIALWGQT